MTTQNVQGEHQPFDAQRVTDRFKDTPLEGKVVFICPNAEQFLIQIVRAKTFVVDNRVVDQEQRVVQFHDHTYISDDPVEIDLIRKHRAYQRGKIRELGQIAKQAKERKVQDVLAQLSDPNVRDAVTRALEQGRASVPSVEGQKRK